MTVLKASFHTPLAIAILVALAGCAKKEAAPAAGTEATPATSSAAPAEAHPVPAAPDSTDVDLSGIVKADGGKTVAEIYAERDQLAGTQVVVRGKVVKTNAGIMERNWLHVQDGTGEAGTNDLTVTTTAAVPPVGTTVLVSGQVATNKDFGLGYQYDVILEDAEVVAE
jgi:hypothetical protein